GARITDGPASEVDLAVGQRVLVTLRSISDGAPIRPLHTASSSFDRVLLARRIEITQEQPQFEGRIVSTDSLPDHIVLNLAPHDPGVVAGLVASADTDVTVQLASLDKLALKLDSEPSLAPDELHVDQQVWLRGTLSGDPQAPLIDANEMLVKP